MIRGIPSAVCRMSQRPAADKPAKPVATAGWTFFRQWLKNPLSIAALSPSGRQLAGRMMHELPSGAKRVVELGGGTGVFTRAMLEHGIEPHNLMVVELNEELYQYLHASFPEVNVVWGNACDLNAIASKAGMLGDGKIDAVISGLGLLSMPRSLQMNILGAAFDVLKQDGCFIQFTYGPKSPIPPDVLQELGVSVRRGGFAWRNLPPASVFVYSRNRSKGIQASRPVAKS